MEPLKAPQWLLLMVAGAVLQATACRCNNTPPLGSAPPTSSASPEVKNPTPQPQKLTPQPQGKQSISRGDHVSSIKHNAVVSDHEATPSPAPNQPLPALPQAPRVVAIIDTTIPERLSQARSRQASALSDLAENIQLAIFTLNQECMEVYSPDQPMLHDRENLLQLLVNRIKPTTTFGTFSHRGWEKMAQFVATSEGPTVIIIESDGDEDDPSPQAQQSAQKAIAQLATLPQLRLVVLIGTNPDQRERIRHELKPLAGRYLIREQEERPEDLSEQVQKVLTTPLQGGIR